MLGGHRPRWPQSLIVGLSILVMVPIAASAGVRSSASRPISGDSADQATTSCGKHQVVAGGGFAIDPGPDFVNVTQSAPAGDHGWKSRLATGPSADGSWRNYAACRHLGSTAIVTVSKPVTNFGAFITTDCPKGKSAIGGGWVTSPPYDPSNPGPFLYTVRSSRSDTGGWRTITISYTETGGKVTGYAVCAAGKVKEVVKKRNVDSVGRTAAVANCPKGTTLLSGGFEHFGFTGSFLASRPKGRRGWKAEAVATQHPDSDAYVKAFAYCRP